MRLRRVTPWTRSFPYRATDARKAARAFVDGLATRLGSSAEMLGYASSAALRQAVDRALYIPDRLPPVSAVATGRDGTLWLRREDEGDALVVWDVIDAEGAVLASLHLSREFRGLRAERDAIWGVQEEDDQPVVVRYPLVRRAQSPAP